MSEENNPTQEVNTSSEKITLKKSTYTGLIISAVVATAIATFLVGVLLGNTQQDSTNSDFVTKSDLKEMITKLESKIDNLDQPTQAKTTQQAANTPIFIPLDDSPVKGSTTAPVTVIEFSDFQCPFCESFFSQTLPQIQQSYIDPGKVKLVYRDFPLESLHANAKGAALAAKCANEQGKFWEYHNKLFEGQTSWASLASTNASKIFKQYAAELGLDTNNFDSCVDSFKYSDKVNKDFQVGTNYGVTGTPTFFIGNDKDGYIKLVGAQPFSVFQQNIKQ